MRDADRFRDGGTRKPGDVTGQRWGRHRSESGRGHGGDPRPGRVCARDRLCDFHGDFSTLQPYKVVG